VELEKAVEKVNKVVMATHPINWDEVYACLLRGEEMRSVAERLGVSESAVGMHAKRHGWMISAARKEVLAKNAVIGVVEELSEKIKSSSERCKVAMCEQLEQIMRELVETEMSTLLRARVLAAVMPVAKALFLWGLAEDGHARNPSGAINIALIRTSPEQLRLMAKRKGDVVEGEAGVIGRQSRDASG